MQQLIDFKKKDVKYIIIFQDLKRILQDSQNYSQKGLLATLLINVKKNLFYDKSWVFSQGSTWHRFPCAEMEGNGSKMDFRAFI